MNREHNGERIWFWEGHETGVPRTLWCGPVPWRQNSSEGVTHRNDMKFVRSSRVLETVNDGRAVSLMTCCSDNGVTDYF